MIIAAVGVAIVAALIAGAAIAERRRRDAHGRLSKRQLLKY